MYDGTNFCGLFSTFAASVLFSATALASDTLTLSYKGRSVDSAPYYYAFPYRLEKVSIKDKKIYFSEHIEGKGKHLFMTEWDPSVPISLDSRTATKVTDVDLNTINFWRRTNNNLLNGIVAEADDDKAERINLWLFPDGAAAPKRLTDVDYVYEFIQSEEQDAIYYTARYGTSDASKGCLEKLSIDEDGSTHTQQLICDDNAEMPARINWWSDLRIDSRRVIFPALKDGDRNKQELYAYNLLDGKVSRVFEGHGKSWITIWEHWGDETQALVSADRELHRIDFVDGITTITHLKTFEKSISNYASFGSPEKPILIAIETPFETKLQTLEITQNGTRVIREERIPEEVWIADVHNDTLLLGKFSPDTYADFDLLTFSNDGTYASNEAISGLEGINDKLSQCNVERVKVTHKDTSDASPGTFVLDVFVYRPKDLPSLEDQKFIITAFYGGKNEFSSYHHLWCALGITTVSPAVRGDWRYGTEFANGNDREKADAPIRDTLAIARYLEKRFNIPNSKQIGTTGYSHGGWAAIRAVSYPGKERMELGFAIAGGGFYDLTSVVDRAKKGETNIHGWFDKEFATADQTDLLKFLSPSEFVEEIVAPIFLYHGERDTRISPDQARAFAKQLSGHEIPHQLMIVPKQGHAIRGPEVWAEIQQSTLDFIANLP